MDSAYVPQIERPPFVYTEDNNIMAKYMMVVNQIEIEDRPKYAPLLPETDTVVSHDRPPSDLVLRLSARLHQLDIEIRTTKLLLDVQKDIDEWQALYGRFTSLNTQFNLLMYFYLGKIEHEFPNFKFASGFFTIRDQDTIVVTLEAMNWITEAPTRLYDLAKLYAFQRKIVLSPLASE